MANKLCKTFDCSTIVLGNCGTCTIRSGGSGDTSGRRVKPEPYRAASPGPPWPVWCRSALGGCSRAVNLPGVVPGTTRPQRDRADRRRHAGTRVDEALVVYRTQSGEPMRVDWVATTPGKSRGETQKRHASSIVPKSLAFYCARLMELPVGRSNPAAVRQVITPLDLVPVRSSVVMV